MASLQNRPDGSGLGSTSKESPIRFLPQLPEVFQIYPIIILLKIIYPGFICLVIGEDNQHKFLRNV